MAGRVFKEEPRNGGALLLAAAEHRNCCTQPLQTAPAELLQTQIRYKPRQISNLPTRWRNGLRIPLQLTMNVQTAYNTWAETYDAVLNKTRDLEATAIRHLLVDVAVAEAIEIGCGTGKNTEWLATKATQLTGVDFSAEMLAKAQAKATSHNIRFQLADITQEWNFVNSPADLITCSLVLEHIQKLDFVFEQASRALRPAGLFYIGELHPFKQYQGSKARFDNGQRVVEVECYTHHVSEYLALAKSSNLECLELREWFDSDDPAAAPRIIAFLFQRK